MEGLKICMVIEAYPCYYTILSANTWEKKTITITGDTTGTWLTTNGRYQTLTFTAWCW
jgi:hypothetical protein